MLDKIMQRYSKVEYMQYSDFYKLEEIGSGGYGTVYTAKYNGKRRLPQTVVLKRFKNFDQTPELFISEVSNNWEY